MKNNNLPKRRYIIFLGAITSLFLLAACVAAANNDEASSRDFGNESSAALANAAKQPGGGAGMEINKSIGHKWKLTYDHKQQEALLEVAIVNWDVDRVVVTDVHHNCSYNFKGSSKGGDVQLELDSIKNNIEDCYQLAGLNPATAVQNTEFYRSIQFEVVGSWNQANSGKFVSHDSFEYGSNASGSKVAMTLQADGHGAPNNRSIAGQSDAFNVPGGGIPTFVAASNLDFWESLHDNPSASLSYLEHYTWVSQTQIAATPKKPMGQNEVAFRIAKSTMTITPPNGFDLDLFIIDPKRFGSGGGG